MISNKNSKMYRTFDDARKRIDDKYFTSEPYIFNDQLRGVMSYQLIGRYISRFKNI